MQRSIVCEASKFLSPFLTNARKNIKPEFLLLDIVLIVKSFFFGGGGEAFPLHPPVDETLQVCIIRLQSDQNWAKSCLNQTLLQALVNLCSGTRLGPYI